MHIAAIICAAGASTRMNGIKKEYRPLPGADSGFTVLGKAVSTFAAIPEVETIVITVPEDGEAAAREALPPELLTEDDYILYDDEPNPESMSEEEFKKAYKEYTEKVTEESKKLAEKKTTIYFVDGSTTRQASVFNALSALTAYAPDFVLIHDGARPWVSASLIRRIIAEVSIHRAIIPILPLTETPKETDAPLNSANTIFIKQHLKRALVGAAQTPQAFAFPEILAAHQKAAEQFKNQPGFLEPSFTDDAEIWAAFCGPVAAICGESENRKITFPEDIA